MHTILLCVAASTLGFKVGWQQLPDGGMEYIIQLDQPTIDALRRGEAIESDIPPAVSDVRAYRIVTGQQKLPHDQPSAPQLPQLLLPPSLGEKPLSAGPAACMEQKKQPPESTAAIGQRPPPPAPAAKQESKPAETHPAEQPPVKDESQNQKPWMPLLGTLLGLFASLGGNAYLGWIAWESRRRWRAAARQFNFGETSDRRP